MAKIYKALVHQKSGVTLLARIRGNGGNLITQASLSSITYAIRDLTDAETDSTGSFTISDVIFDDLQQDDQLWHQDTAIRPGPDESYGYNFKATLSAGSFDDHDVATTSPYEVTRHRFQVDVKFTPTSGQPFVQSWEITSIPVYVS